jgi:UDP-N-acetylmuramate dehydrogenase
MSINSFIKENVPLANKNWFKTGGNARFYCEPQTHQEFQQAIHFAHVRQLETFILGDGANILISDDGFDGLVIRPQIKNITVSTMHNDEAYICADAGVTMSELILFCLEKNILGLEEFSGIPGTVGGSVYINLHYFEFLLEHFLHEAAVMHAITGEIEIVQPSWFEFGYNKSRLQKERYYLLSATFKLKQGTALDGAFARGRHTEIVRHRAKRYPSVGTCGSFFRNFHEHEVVLESNGKKIIFVAYYLDKIGIKGVLREGNALVSHQHANMLVNTGAATSNDIIKLACAMQELVLKEFGITPQPECRLIGFKHYPLLR